MIIQGRSLTHGYDILAFQALKTLNAKYSCCCISSLSLSDFYGVANKNKKPKIINAFEN